MVDEGVIINCVRISEEENKELLTELFNFFKTKGGLSGNRLVVDSYKLIQYLYLNHPRSTNSDLFLSFNSFPITMIVNDV